MTENKWFAVSIRVDTLQEALEIAHKLDESYPNKIAIDAQEWKDYGCPECGNEYGVVKEVQDVQGV
jgi:acetone carboxylase gamma subunit